MSYLLPAGLANVNGYYRPQAPGLQVCAGNEPCKLKVEGKGTVRVQPDTAVVSLGVSTENVKLKPAQEENARIVNDIINSMRRMGISPEDIQTQTYNIEPQYDYVEGKQVFRGYRVLHMLRITVKELGKIGEIIDEAVDKGANMVNRISFTVSEPSRYYQQALNAAIDDALAKAADIGRKLKINVSPIPVQIIEQGYQTGPTFELAMAPAANITTPVQAGQIEITARIEAIFVYGAM